MAVARSQNGLTANDRAVIRSVTIPGTDVRVAVRRGAVGDLLVAAAARWHREVEPLRAADGVLDCWGYAERTIRGSATQLSNHASGSALDFRARAHPLGVPAARNYSPAQVAAIHRIVDDAEGALRWGGDYDNPARGGVHGSRPDPMHLEVNLAEAIVAQVLPRFLARSGASAAPGAASASPPPAPLTKDEDAMHIPVRIYRTQDSDTAPVVGRFAEPVNAEAGGGGWFADGLLTVSSQWGWTRVWVTALAADGKNWQPLTRDPKGGDPIADNASVVYPLPPGTRHVTVEGFVQNAPEATGFGGTRPAVAWLARRSPLGAQTPAA
jgi:hypothetical protein